MRLVCPNCGAQYEVPDGVVPAEGRDVQCSNCGNTWFQVHPDNDSGLADDLGTPDVASDSQPQLSDDTETAHQSDDDSEDEWQGFDDDQAQSGDAQSDARDDAEDAGRLDEASHEDDQEWSGFDEDTAAEPSDTDTTDHEWEREEAEQQARIAAEKAQYSDSAENLSDSAEQSADDAAKAAQDAYAQTDTDDLQSGSDGGSSDLDEAEAETATADVEPREIDPAIADILRQEAETETRAREAEGVVETQGDLGLDQAGSSEDQRAKEASERMARLRGEEPLQEAVAATVASASRRDLLPDVDEINSTLRSTNDRAETTHEDYYDDELEPVARPRGRFRRGFWMMVLAALVLFLLYIFSPQIIKALPALESTMTSYVAMVDSLRVWLDGKVQDLGRWLDTKASTSGDQ